MKLHITKLSDGNVRIELMPTEERGELIIGPGAVAALGRWMTCAFKSPHSICIGDWIDVDDKQWAAGQADQDSLIP